MNEASPYAVFKVSTPAGAAGTYVKLGLQNDSDPATADASLNTDTGNAGTGVPLQYYNGSAWVDYTPGTAVLIPTGGLLVRTGIVNDAPYEGAETFQLKATVTNSSGSTDSVASYGTATIYDDGTGNVFAATNTSGTPDARSFHG